MSKKLEGKVAVVTGGNSGIGLATAQRFADEGAHVFITGRRQAELNQAVKQIGHGAVAVQGDVAKLADLDRLYATVKQQQGRIDVLFANAGGGEMMPLGSITEAHYDQIFGTNVKGLLFTVQKALPIFQDGGAIILNASIAGSKGFEAFSVYCATKAAVRSFARNWTIDLKSRRIRVNAVSPGPVETPILKQFRTVLGDARVDSDIARVGRAGTAGDIAPVVLFLCSDGARWINGANVPVDGGLEASINAEMFGF